MSLRDAESTEVLFYGRQHNARPVEQFDVPVAICSTRVDKTVRKHLCHLRVWRPYRYEYLTTQGHLEVNLRFNQSGHDFAQLASLPITAHMAVADDSFSPRNLSA